MARIAIAVGLVVSLAASSAAQTPGWGRGTGLAVTGGVTHADDHTRGVFGGAALWELTARLAVEGSGRWMDRGLASDAFAGNLAALIGLGGTRETAVPYVAVGVGLYRRSFDWSQAPDLDALPGFYRRRLGDGPGPLSGRRSFTDPSLVFGTGVDIALSRNVVVRPDVRVLFVMDGRRHDSVTVASVSVGYRFDHKPVTP